MNQSMLLACFKQLMEQGWKNVFTQQRVFNRVRRLSVAMLINLRMHLTSSAICATGRQSQDWTADYRVCSESPWNPRQLFDPILDALPGLLSSPQAPVLVALDDTMIKKTGRKIPGVAIGRDPMSPPFHVNLCYGLRFVQASVLVAPLDRPGAARALPVRFELAPPAVKPKRKSNKTGDGNVGDQPMAAGQAITGAEKANKATKKPDSLEEAAYKQDKKLRRLPQVGLNTIHSIRQSMNERPALRDRILIVSGDGSYTNRLILRGLPEKTVYIGRIRKDAKLHWPVAAAGSNTNGRPRLYGPKAPTPDELLKEESVEPTHVSCFAAGEVRSIPVKGIKTLYWRNAGVDVPVQVVVIKPLGYRLRKGSKLLYRQPAFLICTDPDLPLQALVQDYLYRWEIECNHRDEKSLLGVGQGQVRNPEAVRRLPQLQVATYSLLLLASLLSSGFARGQGEYLPLPKWRRLSESARPSVLDMLNLLRQQIFAQSLDQPLFSFEPFDNDSTDVDKPQKPPLTAETLATLAA